MYCIVMMEVPVMICPLKTRAQSNYNGCHTSILCGWWYRLGSVRITLRVVNQYECMLLSVYCYRKDFVVL
jgi:hypothetical protein